MSSSLAHSLPWNMSSLVSLLLLALCGLAAAQGGIRVFSLRATGLPADALGIADGYVKVFSGAASLGKTSTLHNQINPWWEEEFVYRNALENDVLRLEVYDSDLIFDDRLGVCTMPLRKGSFDHQCALDEGGSLYYSYTLS